MAEFLTAVGSVRTHEGNDGDEDALLKAVDSTRPGVAASVTPLKSSRDHKIEGTTAVKPVSSSPEDALQLLRSQPTIDEVVDVLRQLSPVERGLTTHGEPFSLHIPGPVQAQIIHTLLSTTVPDFWPLLDNRPRNDLVACLRNVAGLNAVCSRLKLLTAQAIASREKGTQSISDLLDIVQQLLTSNTTVSHVWRGLQVAVSDQVKRELSWKEFISLITSGKVVSTVAQAEDSSRNDSIGCWLAKGGEYAAWLGKNIAELVALAEKDESAVSATGALLTKALSLGYTSQLLSGLFETLALEGLQGKKSLRARINVLLAAIPAHANRSFTERLLLWLSSLCPDLQDDEMIQQSLNVSSLAGLLSVVFKDPITCRHACEYLADPVLTSSISHIVRRAALSVLFAHGNKLQDLLDQMLSTFGDALFANHSPILQQERLAETILLVAAYLHKASPTALLMIARSSNHMKGVSNRLDSSNARARWLGMVIATAISSLVDKVGSRVNFGTEEMTTEEALSYVELVKTTDTVGSLEDFANLISTSHGGTISKSRPSRGRQAVLESTRINGKPVFGPPRPPVQTEVIGEKVTEILDNESSEDEDDLKPYAKPDSDPEDSDEDATLVNRKKVRPPVYIRDLMAMLRDDQNHDRFQLGIKHAATLIRRKANFGTEVKDHAQELAIILCSLQDPFNTEGFDELKLQALIAILLSDFNVLAPWCSKQAFSGDYSVAQRCVILSTLGLSGRELAGLADVEELNPALKSDDFPSKRLPPHLQSVYTPTLPSTKRLEAASEDIEHALIQPLALQAADQSTASLNAVKVRTFSSRMDVERTKRKPVPNQLAKVFGETLFLPLVSRYQQEVASYGSSSVFASVPFVLVTFIKTIALLFHAAGPATLGLTQITAEFWDLLLSLRVKAVTDITILQAVLFSLLTLLEVNHDKKRIAEDNPRQLLETQRWVNLVFERTGGGSLITDSGSEDETKVRTLAAAVLVKTKEIIDAYQKQLVGIDSEW